MLRVPLLRKRSVQLWVGGGRPLVGRAEASDGERRGGHQRAEIWCAEVAMSAVLGLLQKDELIAAPQI